MNESDHELEGHLADERSRIKKGPLRIFIRVVAVSAVIPIILATDGFGPSYLDSVGRVLFWSGMVLGPMFAFNLDVLRTIPGMIFATGLTTVQLLLAIRFFERLNGVSLIVIAIFGLVQCVLFEMPFMLIRKRYSGIWY